MAQRTHLKNVLLMKLLNVGIVKHGDFILKSGAKSNIYLDFRKMMCFPEFFKYMEMLTDELHPDLFSRPASTRILPVPMGGIPFGTYLAFQKNVPFLMVRDKPKGFETNVLEGEWNLPCEVVVVEDVISTGKSVHEMLANLTKYGYNTMKFKAILTICNRGSTDAINGIPIVSLFNLDDIVATFDKDPMQLEYFRFGSDAANALYGLALKKKSNIILSCDFMPMDRILDTVAVVADNIVAVKLHLDTLTPTPALSLEQFGSSMRQLAETHGLTLIDDAKIADIEAIEVEKMRGSGSTLRCDAMTMHAVSGLSILGTQADVCDLIVVTEMSSRDNMLTEAYTRQALEGIRGAASKSKLFGVVCQGLTPQLLSDPFEVLTMSPGISVDAGMATDGANQQYSDPTRRRLGLFWIVGRAITQGAGQAAAADYQHKGWQYFLRY